MYPQTPQQHTGKQGRVRKVVAGVVGLAMLAGVATGYAAGKDYRSNSNDYRDGGTGYKLACSFKPGLCQELPERPSPRPEHTPPPTPKYNSPYPTPRPSSGSVGGATLAK
jgi:hypothetical protein